MHKVLPQEGCDSFYKINLFSVWNRTLISLNAELVARVNRVQVSSPGGESGTNGGLITWGAFMSSSLDYCRTGAVGGATVGSRVWSSVTHMP